MKEHLTK